MIIKLETFSGEAGVYMELNPVNGMWTVTQRSYGGEVVNKMSFDTKESADGYYNQWCDELKKEAV